MTGIGGQRFLDNLGIDEVILEPLRKRRGDGAGHNRGILADKISHISHIVALLEHMVGAFQIIGKQIQVAEPCVLAVELIAERAVNTRYAGLVGLGNHKVQQRGIDSFGKETVATLFHSAR